MNSARRLVAIMFTDIVGYTAMMEKDEKMALAKVKAHERAMESLVAEFKGELIQFYGDGSLSIFSSALEAVSCAKALQLRFKEEVPVRIGIHVGEVTQEDGKTYGSAVNVASRIESSGHAGTILFSSMVQDKIKNDTSLQSQSLGLFQFKNVEKPMEIFALNGESLVPVEISSLSNKVSKRKGLSSIGYGISAIGLIIISFFLVNVLTGASSIPKEVKEERIAIAIYDNQTGDESLDILGNYLSDDLYRGFSMLEGVKLSSAEVVKENVDYLGVLPGNDDKKPSFYELTGAKFTVEGSYYLFGKDSVEVKTSIVNKISGVTVYSFDAIKGDVETKEELAKTLRNFILGYWASRNDESYVGILPPKFDAYQEFVKGGYQVDIDKTIEHYRKSIKLDPRFIAPYYNLSGLYLFKNDMEKVDSINESIESMSELLSIDEKYELLKLLTFSNGNFERGFSLSYEKHLRDPTHFKANYQGVYSALNNNYANLAIEISSHINDSEINYRIMPNWFQWRLGNIARAYNKLGQYQKTIELLDEHAPVNSNYSYAIWMKIRAYANLGLDEEIEQLASLRKGTSNINQFFVNLYAAYEYYLLGDEQMVSKFTERSIYQSEFEFDSIPKRALANLYYLSHDYKKAKKTFLEMAQEDPENVALNVFLAVMDIHLSKQALNFEGLLVEIEKKGKSISRNLGYPIDVIPYAKAILYAHLGEKEQAMDYIKMSYDSGVHFFYDRYDWDPNLRPLFDYPPFQEFVRPKEYIE